MLWNRRVSYTKRPRGFGAVAEQNNALKPLSLGAFVIPIGVDVVIPVYGKSPKSTIAVSGITGLSYDNQLNALVGKVTA